MSRSIFENIDNIIVSSLETITISEVPGLVAKYMSDTDSINFRDIDKYMLIFLYPNKFNMNQSMPKGVRKTKLQGYSEVKEFFNPDYKEAALPEDILYRRTLYWNPTVKTDEKGEAVIQFYNNNSCTNLQIDMQGLDKTGKFILNKE